MRKLELFEQIRKAHFNQNKSIRQIAKEQKVHRRTVRQAISDAIPPLRNNQLKSREVLTEAHLQTIDLWLQADKKAPRKQRHTSRRMYIRLKQEYDYAGSESHLRRYISRRKRILCIPKEAFVLQCYMPGQEAEMDWYEAYVELNGINTKLYFFQMRSCFSKKLFTMAFYSQNQQSFLEGHRQAFEFFGGVFPAIRYDNLSSAVKRVLKGRRRIETEQFIALRSHYLFESLFCIPGKKGAHEKGGIENSVGYFRRSYLTPILSFKNISELNIYLLACCKKDEERIVQGYKKSIAHLWQEEKMELKPLPERPFNTCNIRSARVSDKALISIDSNQYSVPTYLVGQTLEVQVSCYHIRCCYRGKCVAEHQRSNNKQHIILDIQHYLSLLKHKPGAFKHSLVLQQARQKHAWPHQYDRYWEALQNRFGHYEGTRQFLELLWEVRNYETDIIISAIEQSMQYGALSKDSMMMLLRQKTTPEQPPNSPLLVHERLIKFERKPGGVKHYDDLLNNLGGKICQPLIH